MIVDKSFQDQSLIPTLWSCGLRHPISNSHYWHHWFDLQWREIFNQFISVKPQILILSNSNQEIQQEWRYHCFYSIYYFNYASLSSVGRLGRRISFLIDIYSQGQNIRLECSFCLNITLLYISGYRRGSLWAILSPPPIVFIKQVSNE